MNYSQKIENLLNSNNIKILKKQRNSLLVGVHTGSKKRFSVPLRITPDLAYLTACIICDGHMRKDKYRIVFESVDEKLVDNFTKIFNKTFLTNEKYRVRREKRSNKKTPYRVVISGKPIVLLFEHLLKIPRGKKSHLVYVPRLIMNGSTDIKFAFLKGVFETDGGKRGKRLGLSSASVRFRDDVCKLINTFNIKVSKDQWINKTNRKTYYGLKFAGVPKWSKGLESFR